jgi:hypothetical protein
MKTKLFIASTLLISLSAYATTSAACIVDTISKDHSAIQIKKRKNEITKEIRDAAWKDRILVEVLE